MYKVVISRSYHITSQDNRSNQIKSTHLLTSNPIHISFTSSSSYNLNSVHVNFIHNNHNNVFLQPRNKQRLLPPVPQPRPKIRQGLNRRRRELPSYPIYHPSIPILFHRLITPSFIDNERVPHGDWRLRKQTQRRGNGPTST
jgi:hypothetical protein